MTRHILNAPTAYDSASLNSEQMHTNIEIRSLYRSLDAKLKKMLPPGRYRYTALDALEKSSMYAIKSVSHDWDIADD